jgi:purine-binding chemotaxis protein CheW
MANEKAVVEKQLVVFNLGGEAYGVDISVVREIIHIQPITRVPGTPHSVEGVINLRGSVIPVVDLRKKFQLEVIQRGKDTRIVVVSCRGQDIGVIVDSVAEVLRISVDTIEPPSTVVTGGHLEHLMGIVKMTGRLVILLDMDQVLSRQDIVAINSSDLLRDRNESKSQSGQARGASKEATLVK